MRVLVTGGQDYDDREAVFAELDTLHRATKHDCMLVIQGGAVGADKLAREWCVDRAVPYKNYPANWEAFGNAAGPLRNQRMLDDGKPDIVLAFPGGRGTQDMITRALRAGVRVEKYEPHRESRA